MSGSIITGVEPECKGGGGKTGNGVAKNKKLATVASFKGRGCVISVGYKKQNWRQPPVLATSENRRCQRPKLATAASFKKTGCVISMGCKTKTGDSRQFWFCAPASLGHYLVTSHRRSYGLVSLPHPNIRSLKSTVCPGPKLCTVMASHRICSSRSKAKILK